MRFLKSRWHSIPVGLVSVLLALALVGGGVVAAVGYGFFTATVKVTVVEAIAVGVWPAWDNLEPYGSVDDVNITLAGESSPYTLTITTLGGDGYVGYGFTANESIVIPVNIRNGSDGTLTLTALVTGGQNSGITLDYIWQANPGPVSSRGPENQPLCREFKANGTWQSLGGWTGTIAGNGGKSGSAIVGAQVLFVRISAPGDVVPGTYTFGVTLERS